MKLVLYVFFSKGIISTKRLNMEFDRNMLTDIKLSVEKFIMKPKGYLIIFALFFLLLLSLSAVAAESNDTIDNVTSDADDSISQNQNSDVALDSQQKDVELTSNANASSQSVSTVSSKETAKIAVYSNYVKKGSKYYMYLMDASGKAIPNKKLAIKYNGKTTKQTTDKYGRVAVKVGLSKPYTSIKVSFSGDKKYKAVSKTFWVYIVNSVPMTIGNSKLLTNGCFRVYLNGHGNAISYKAIKIIIGKKTFTKKTTSEGFVVIKPQVPAKTYTVLVKYANYKLFKKIKCINGNVSDPLKTAIPTKNGVPDIDVMPENYVMGSGNAKYTLLKAQYIESIKRDSYTLFQHGKLSKYTFFKTKASPNVYHIIKREKWNVIERAINTIIVKKNKKSGYWPSSVTVSLEGKSYTYPEVRDIQNTEYTCGAAASSVCSQVLKNFYSEKYFEITMHCLKGKGVNIPVIKDVLDQHNFKTEYFNKNSFKNALKELKNGAALIAYLSNHYVTIIDVSPDGKKVLVSNSYGDYNVGGLNKVPTGWVSFSYFLTKFKNTGLVVKLDYKLPQDTQNQIKGFYSSMGGGFNRQNTNERIPNIGL